MTLIGKKKPRKVKVPPRLWESINAVEIAGVRLSNLAFNLSQCPTRVPNPEDRLWMQDSYKEWDVAARKLAELLK